jgi:hypothetical protein
MEYGGLTVDGAIYEEDRAMPISALDDVFEGQTVSVYFAVPIAGRSMVHSTQILHVIEGFGVQLRWHNEQGETWVMVPWSNITHFMPAG